VLTDGAGHATLSVSPIAGAGVTQVAASLTNGSSVTAQFTAAAAPSISGTNPVLYVAAGAQVSWTPVVLVQSAGAPVAGAGVTWTVSGTTGGSGLTLASPTSTTNAAGLAQVVATVGPLAAGASATLSACEALAPALCTAFTAYGEDPSRAQLVGTSGVGQVLTAGTMPGKVSFEVTDAAGRPLAGAAVEFYELLQAWQPSCPATGRCPAPETLATQAVSTVSDANGMVSLTPLTDLTQPTVLTVNATTGNQASVMFQIVEHP
jgi:hypothetical protein